MDLRLLIEEIASQAEEFLAGTSDRAKARAGIAELLAADYSGLDPASRKNATEGVMAILEDEDFFGVQCAGGAFDDEPEDEGEA